MEGFFRKYGELTAVLVDNYEGVAHGMETLIGKGYRRIALVTIETEMAHMKDRLHAYCDVLRRHNIPEEHRLVKIIPYNSDHERALEEVEGLLSGAGTDIDAVFFLTNYLCFLVIECI